MTKNAETAITAMVPGGGFEPPTRGFSIRFSFNQFSRLQCKPLVEYLWTKRDSVNRTLRFSILFLALTFGQASALGDSSKEALEAFPNIRVKFVRSGFRGMPPKATAHALRTSNGQRWILINLDQDLSDMEYWFLHEVAHHIAWDRYGEDIDTHGPEFRAECRKLVKVRQSYYCAG